MQLIRTILWIAVTAVLVAFVAMNWDRAPVNLWPLADGYLQFNWPVGVIAIVFFLLGLVPMWLLHRTARWRLNRRIATLENSARANATSAAAVPPAPPIATSSQLSASNQDGTAA